MQRLLVVLVAATALVACGDGGATTPTGPAGLLDVLPACGEPPGPAIDVDVGLPLPATTAVLERTEQGPLTFLTAYVGMTPVEVRESYEADDGVELLVSEDEILEVELLFTDRVRRAYLKGTATCRTGTTLTVVVADEVEGAPDLVPEGAFDAG